MRVGLWRRPSAEELMLFLFYLSPRAEVSPCPGAAATLSSAGASGNRKPSSSRGVDRSYWCFWTVVLEKTLESPLDCKEIQPVHSEGDQPWDFFGRNNGKAETPVLWPLHAKNWFIGKGSDDGKDWGQEEKGMTEDEMAGWHHWLDGHESQWTLVAGDGHGGLACCDSWGRKESDTTERLIWSDFFYSFLLYAMYGYPKVQLFLIFFE